MTFDDPDLLAEFIAESRDHLSHVEGQLLEIEAGGDDVNIDLVNNVFRGIHSIKGAAGFLGLVTVNKLAHSLENVLGLMRTRELTPNSATIDVMLRAADALSHLILHAATSSDVDVELHVVQLDAIFSTAQSGNSTKRLVAEVAVEIHCTNSIESEVEHSPRTTTPIGGDSLLHETCQRGNDGEAIAPVASAVSADDHAPASTSAPNAASTSGVAETSIRVQVGVLDCLMNLAGELVLGRNQLIQSLSAESHAGIEAVASRLDQVTTELQEAIMRTRMQPIGAVFRAYLRTI